LEGYMQHKRAQFLGSCPYCSVELRQEKAMVVKKDAEAITFHVDCVSCKSSLLLSVQSGVPGLVTTVGVPTDLEKRDITRFKKDMRAITTDDVLDLHAYLEKDV